MEKRLFIHYMLSSCLSFVSPLLFPFSFAVTFIFFLILYEAMEYKRRKWRREGMYKTTVRDLKTEELDLLGCEMFIHCMLGPEMASTF
ncbi:hypothetical protein NC653_027790 [Populus alba x Populus x berolinensis]|uniref:Uncharacterized protein n=1 Tax=Populus alba x Populus x berolinensis TaxID=444605 RepID=A0AAD6M691_9ROSI|nr:hypothetical protein NC653_027790 [Populus alba x Populus x berolinensis]